MKIDQVEHFLLGNSYVVRLTTDTGISGIGTSACWGYPEAIQAIARVFKEYLIGQNPMRIEHHWQHLYRMAPFRGTALCGAVSAMDIALYDIKGKHFQVPVWELLGGNCRDKIRLHLLAGGPTPEQMYKNAKAAVVEGFTAIKFDPITGGYQNQAQSRIIQNAVEIVAAAREGAGPDVDLIVEVHRKLTPMVAVALGEALIPYHLYFMEDPIQIDTITTQAEIAKRIPVPLGNGERFTSIWEFRELLEHGGPQYLRPDIALAGGPDPLQKKSPPLPNPITARSSPTTFSVPLGTAASLHLDASIPNFITQEYSKNDEAEHNAVYKCACTNAKAAISPFPKLPGLGR